MVQKARFRLGRVDITLAFAWGWWMLGGSFRRKKWALGGKSGSRHILAHDYRVAVSIIPCVWFEASWAGKLHFFSHKEAAAKLKELHR